jgi:ADP-L-glycero-D-manno-heptose 6-epimerase
VVAINLYFADRPGARGIYNAGTGQSRSFNDIARAIIRLLGNGRIEYVPFPETLRGKYQSFTEADVTRLRAAGYDRPFTSLEEGIKRLCDGRGIGTGTETGSHAPAVRGPRFWDPAIRGQRASNVEG